MSGLDPGFWLPVLTVLSSLLPGVAISALPEERHRTRTALNLTGALAKLVLVGVMLLGIERGASYEARLPLVAGLDLVLHARALPMLFVSLSAVLWLLTTVYAIGYLEGAPNRARFFGAFSVCVSATTGVALAGSLLTFVIFYELLTLATYPLVVHRGTPEALRAGRVYLAYTLGGGALVLVGSVWLHALAGPFDFVEGGAADLRMIDRGALTTIFALLIAGLGVKTALVPLHGWLPVAMVAPAPVSALLHAVAVVKAGAFGVVRVVYDVFGSGLCADLGVTRPLALLAAATILWGSVRALHQDELKRRLAYSTVSQVSYVVLGVAVAGPMATIGGLVHLVHQGLMKITMFFCAGNLAETLEVHRVSELKGVGRRMPLTMAAFTVAALGMIGVPPLAGFVSKWFLGLGAIDVGEVWVVPVLVTSSLLNAAYFLPIVRAAWFEEPAGPWPADHAPGRVDAPWLLLGPPLVTAALTVLVGVFAASPLSPLEWCRLIVLREYGP
ncbi:MAG: monovalent cation/H+ antiporter subunit D family protein [Planctomycetes bacterium]|nr:monovalent cation/H+ antiporter subunit D family protein [Planctomycetota bacterium]